MKRFVIAGFVVFLLAPGSALGYSQTAHVVIAQFAHAELSDSARERVSRIATALLDTQPSGPRKEILRRHPNASLFAVLASLPDDWKRNRMGKITLGDVFRWYLAGPVTGPYAASANTSAWHYINVPYPFEREECDLSQEQDILDGLGKSRAAFGNATNDRARGIALAFIAHLVGDAHQPLHAVARVDEDCRSDRGGNDFCLDTRDTGGECPKSLHWLWDSGVGFVVDPGEIPHYVDVLRREYPADEVAREGALDPKLWLAESRSFAPFVYDTREDHAPSKHYIDAGRNISRLRMALAAHRLAALVEVLVVD